MKSSILLFSLFFPLLANAKQSKFDKNNKLNYIECGKKAENIALRVTEANYDQVEGINPEERPTPPFEKGSLNPQEKINYLPNSRLTKKDSLEYYFTVHTNKGNWECSYKITMKMNNNQHCSFEKIVLNNCAGGVIYPK